MHANCEKEVNGAKVAANLKGEDCYLDTRNRAVKLRGHSR